VRLELIETRWFGLMPLDSGCLERKTYASGPGLSGLMTPKPCSLWKNLILPVAMAWFPLCLPTRADACDASRFFSLFKTNSAGFQP